MRLLKRNMTDLEYLPYSGMETDLNEDGEHTGEFHPKMSDPVPLKGNMSTPNGQVNQTFYGTDERYTHVLLLDNPKADIRKTGKIRWKGELYDILAVQPSLNVMSIALRKQTENESEREEFYEFPDQECPV